MKIQQNIGVVCVKQGLYSDAITAFEHIMDQEANFRTGFNLILCYFALGDKDKMKRTFQKLLTVDQHHNDEDKYIASNVSFSVFYLFACCMSANICDIRKYVLKKLCNYPYIFYFSICDKFSLLQ